MPHILLLEDDLTLAETMIDLLEDESFTVTHAQDGQEALDYSYAQSFDLFIFDVNVSYINGFELLKSLRTANDETPAIFITSLNDIASLSRGFEVGADDYLKKPFDFDELLIRIDVIFKRKHNLSSNEIIFDDFSFDLKKDELYRESKFVHLSKVELKITKMFFKNLNSTLTKDDILYELSHETQSSDGALRVHINKLRKIGLPLTTIKGIGYRLG